MDIYDKIKQYIDIEKYKSTVTKFRLSIVALYAFIAVMLIFVVLTLAPYSIFIAFVGIAIVTGGYYFMYKRIFDIANRAMAIDGDPIKWLTISSVIKNPVFFRYQYEDICMSVAFWLGKYDEASRWADVLIASNKAVSVANGYCTKARAAFFLGDYFTMRECIYNYRTTVQRYQSKNGIARFSSFYNGFLNLMEAIAADDKEKICAYGKVLTSSKTGATTISSYIEYMKGLAAYLSGNYSDAARWFKLACESKDETVYPSMAKEYLDKLGDYANVSLYGDSTEINREKYDYAIKSLKNANKKFNGTYYILNVLLGVLTIVLTIVLPLNVKHYALLGFIAAYFLLRFLAVRLRNKLWAPFTNCLFVEGDPEKYLNILMAVETAMTGCHIKLWHRLTVALAVGDFESALFYANNAIAVLDNHSISAILFAKARAEYFLGRFDNMKSTIERFRLSANRGNVFGEDYEGERKCGELLKLLEAIADGDKEQIAACGNAITPWSRSVMVNAHVEYFKGVAAYLTDDSPNAVLHFKKAQELGAKTINVKFAQDYLDKIE